MSSLLELLARELERPRAVSEQVVKHLTGTYSLGREEVGAFLVDELPKLEEYEIDLALAPLFTPTLSDQSVFAGALGSEGISAEQVSAFVPQLAARPTLAELITEDRETHRVPLREVTIERFVRRLRLEGHISERILRRVQPLASAPGHATLLAVARRAIWENEGRQEILVRFLDAAETAQRVTDAVELLKLAETYEPASVTELTARIPHWQSVLREELNSGSAVKPFFNERVEELHGGGRDQRRQDNARQAVKQAEFDFLGRLQRIFGMDQQ